MTETRRQEVGLGEPISKGALSPRSSDGGNRVVSAFPYLGETGLYAVISGSFSPDGFDPNGWINRIGPERRRQFIENRNDFEITMRQIYQLLGVSSSGEIPPLLASFDSPQRENARKIANRLTLGQYGLDKNDRGEDRSDEELSKLMSNIAGEADEFMELQANRPWFKRSWSKKQYSGELELNQDVVDATSPADLICIVLDKSYSRKVRFQAKFKLEVMDTHAAIIQGDFPNKLKKQHQRFMGFVGRHVLKGPIGEARKAFLVAGHSEDDFSATEVGFFTSEEERQAEEYQSGRVYGTKDPILQRTFVTEDDQEIPVYFHTRVKTEESAAEKMMRNADKNRDRAVTDFLGSTVVLPDRAAINEFKLALVKGGAKAGILVTIRVEEDTLDGGEYSAKNIGSSKKLKQYKMVVQLMGLSIELIAHTYRTYVDSIHQDEVGRDEFEATRFFETGLAEASYPEDVFEINMKEVYKEYIDYVRNKKRGIIPSS